MWILSDLNLTNGNEIIFIKKTDSEIDSYGIVVKKEIYTLFFNSIELNAYDTYQEAFSQLLLIFNGINSVGTEICLKLMKGNLENGNKTSNSSSEQ